MTNPVLVEVTRGALVECQHRGALAVVSASGDSLLELGDIARPVYPRSAVKALQAIPFIESGAAAHFGFGWREMALAAASHAGSERHVEVARGMLERIELSEHDLCCGTHNPFDDASSRALIIAQRRPTTLHHNCSGKHLAMLATAMHLDEPLITYWQPDHPVQRRVHEVLEDIGGEAIGTEVCGTDGCSVPNWAMPARTLARAFSRFGQGSDLPECRRAAIHDIMQACWAEPELVGGEGRLDTLVMARFPGEIFIKTGADGAYCGSFVKRGLGFALKIDDGATRAAEAVVIALIEMVMPEARGAFKTRILRNARGDEVGEVRPATVLAHAAI